MLYVFITQLLNYCESYTVLRLPYANRATARVASNVNHFICLIFCEFFYKIQIYLLNQYASIHLDFFEFACRSDIVAVSHQ